MKKIILAALASALFAIGAMAQYRPSFIVSAGYQGANLSGLSNSKIASGTRAGVAVDFGIVSTGLMDFTIQPGLNFSMKGYSYEVESLKLKTKDTNYYIDLPILANLRFAAGNSLAAFVNTGPYLAYGVGGSSKVNDNSKNINPFSEDGELKAFDWGIQVGAGVEFNRLMLTVGSQFGLYDITKNVEIESLGINWGSTNKNTAFFVTAGYRF